MYKKVSYLKTVTGESRLAQTLARQLSGSRGGRARFENPAMPSRSRSGLTQRANQFRRAPKVSAADIPLGDAGTSPREKSSPARPVPHFSAGKRLLWFGMLCWTNSYDSIISSEMNGNCDLIQILGDSFTSKHMLRKMEREGSVWAEAGLRRTAAQIVADRINDAAGHLHRARHKDYIPFSQAVKGISYLYCQVHPTTWYRERSMRRIVGRQWATKLLTIAAMLRPPPPFEVHDAVFSFCVDQTYIKHSGAGSGTSAFRPVQTVRVDGSLRSDEERMVYCNAHHYPTPAAFPRLSAAARIAIANWGPYTQDFTRIIPLLQPDRMGTVMDELVVRTSHLLAGLGAGFSNLDALHAILSRPNADPGGPSYIVPLPPLLNTDTKSYADMLRILDWLCNFINGIPLVLHIVGDGQTCLRMRDLKRHYPKYYKHVLIGNGHFHSSAHFQFMCCTVWWLCLLSSLAAHLGKDLVGPDIKDLTHNTHMHTLQFLSTVTVSILVYLQRHVTSPPPDLFLQNPVLYISMVENAGGVVLLEFLRHAGLPTIFWQRAARAWDSALMDDLHCLALHLFRAAHKTSSSQISLLHLVSVFGVHPELRQYVRDRAFCSLLGNIGASIPLDRALEVFNGEQKERTVGRSLLEAMAFAKLLPALSWIHRRWKAYIGAPEPALDGYRPAMANEIEILVGLFVSLSGTDLRTRTSRNPYWHTGRPVNNATTTDFRGCKPWEWFWMVAMGRSAGMKSQTRETWVRWMRRHVTQHMFGQ